MFPHCLIFLQQIVSACLHIKAFRNLSSIFLPSWGCSPLYLLMRQSFVHLSESKPYFAQCSWCIAVKSQLDLLLSRHNMDQSLPVQLEECFWTGGLCVGFQQHFKAFCFFYEFYILHFHSAEMPLAVPADFLTFNTLDSESFCRSWVKSELKSFTSSSNNREQFSTSKYIKAHLLSYYQFRSSLLALGLEFVICLCSW